MVSYTTSTYNTGWMPGDIKLATLSDTKIEKVGVDESTELVNNGDFSGGFDAANDGWYDQPASGSSTPWTISGGTASHTGDQSYLQQNNVFEIGKQYVLTFTVTGTTILPGGTGLTQSNVTFNTGTHTYIGTALTTDLSFYSNTATTLDDVSVTETGELITNGTFDNGTVGWTNNNSTLEIDSSTGDSRLKITDNGASASAYQLIKTVAGKKYTANVIATSLDQGDGRFEARDQSVTGTVLNSIDPIGLIQDEVLTFNFIASSDDTIIILGGGSSTGNVAYFDNISVRLAEDDRSVNDNGLQIFGEITKTPVVPGADLVAYSGFSAENYLVQPYNSDLDFGTGDFSIMGWFNAGSSTGIVKGIMGKFSAWDSTDPAFSSRTGFNIAIHTDGSFYFYSSSNGTLEYTAFSGAGMSLHKNTWNHFCVNRTGGYIKTYINGSEYSSITTNNINLTTDQSIYMGKYPNPHSSCENGLSLIRISKTAPTDAQIAKIYRDEKVLFQDGAQATLYGTSDAVTALAYDDKTELLHVGTSGGRSDFSGLRRINNTTTAVTTSISASNNLIAEQ